MIMTNWLVHRVNVPLILGLEALVPPLRLLLRHCASLPQTSKEREGERGGKEREEGRREREEGGREREREREEGGERRGKEREERKGVRVREIQL